MRKNENLLGWKYKCYMAISSLPTCYLLKFQLEFQEHCMSCKLLEVCAHVSSEEKNKTRELVRNVMKPIYVENEDTYIINYGVIKCVSLIESSKISLLLFNPISPSNLMICFSKIESVGLMFNKPLSYDGLNTMIKFLTFKINTEVKFLIEQFLFFFNVLREGLDSQTGITTSTEERLIKCFNAGKRYYEKSINELKKQDKLKTNVKKKLIENKSLFNNMNKSDIIIIDNEEIDMDKLIDYMIPDNCNYCTFDSMLPEIRAKCIVFLEDSILLFFQIVSIEYNLINLKKIDKTSVAMSLKDLHEKEKRIAYGTSLTPKILNRSFNNKIELEEHNPSVKNHPKTNNRSINIIRPKSNLMGDNNLIDKLNQNDKGENVSASTKTNSDKKVKGSSIKMFSRNEGHETPKFCERNLQDPDEEKKLEDLKNNISFSVILKKIEEAKRSHAFAPCNDTFNIFNNTTEIIHRKFFELCFEEYLGRIFIFEKDQNGLIKLDSMYNFFLYLRGLKQLLFTDKNKVYFSNVFFMEE